MLSNNHDHCDLANVYCYINISLVTKLQYSCSSGENMADKIAVVTGSNKGIGYVIVRELCCHGVGVAYLTARDENRGNQAVESLKREGFNPIFHQLEVTDKESVKRLAETLKERHGGVDILINNAAIITENFRETTYEDSVQVLNVNYYSILTIQEYIFPILKDNARVINISSGPHPYFQHYESGMGKAAY